MSNSLVLAHANALVHELRCGLDYSGTQRPAIIKTLSDLIAHASAIESELATLRASVVAAMSSAGPSEEDRTG